ncbi:MAG: matrixin family metalloprotease [Pseudobdellovibrio sp.]
MKWKYAVPIIILLSAMTFLSFRNPKRQEKDCGFVQNVYGQRVSWKTKFPIPLVIHASVPPELRPAIYRAANTWESQIGSKVFEISEDSTKISGVPLHDQKNGIYFLSEWESDRSLEQGRTNVLWAGDEIQEADIRINGANFSYYNLNPQEFYRSFGVSTEQKATAVGYSFEALVLHEMGHFLGLKHRENLGEDLGTVMATHLAAFVDRTQLSVSDQGSIRCEYLDTKNRFSFLN